ncbi:MAG TPA: glycosyltransferase family 39 protein, partial [Candidatus Limnocylindrales bacterium]|nr:glycosyltransferase family 39 protein [Candidatus Limnocylindrales bacterium]
PIPSNAHWMPLASLVQVPFIWLLGPTAIASALPFALAGATAAPLAWAIARDAGFDRRVALGAGILTAIPGLSLVYMVQTDNFSLYQPLVAASLWMAARGLRGDARAFLLAGLLGGLATLSRNDGLLVLGVLGLTFLWDRARAWRSGGSRPARIPFPAGVASAAVFVAVVSPWWARQLAVFGQLSPSTASGKVLFIRDIGEWNSITTPATLEHLLGMGLGPLLQTRVEGLIAAVTIYGVLVGVGVLVPLMLIGAWRHRRDSAFGPYFAYAIVLFAFSALVSAVHVPGGTFIHSAVALAPHGYVLALAGIAVAVDWMAERRRSWQPARATRIFTTAAVGFAVVAAVAGTVAVHATWDARRDRMQAVATALDVEGAPVTDRLMSIDAAGYRYHTGRGGVVLVNDPLPTIETVARAYGIRWLVLERDDGVPAVAPLLDGRLPAWVGAPVWSEPPRATEVAVGLYPVCFDPLDDRCSGGIT